jgi:hypothetical protein
MVALIGANLQHSLTSPCSCVMPGISMYGESQLILSRLFLTFIISVPDLPQAPGRLRPPPEPQSLTKG